MGGYLAATKIQEPLNKKSWNIEWNNDYKNFAQELTWRANVYSVNKFKSFINRRTTYTYLIAYGRKE